MSKVSLSSPSYSWRVFYRRVIGAARVLFGRNASVPKGSHSTSIGVVEIDDYYGGLIFSVGGRENYWMPTGYDGSGACVNCREAGEQPLDAPA